MGGLKAMLLLGLLVVAAASVSNCGGDPDPSNGYQKIIVAVTPWPGSASLYVARAIASEHIGVESLVPLEEWKDYPFTASLEQSLVLNLEDQARWMIKKHLGSTRSPRNFMHFIEADGLKSVEPAAVRITGT
jgi:hypothetical protein